MLSEHIGKLGNFIRNNLAVCVERLRLVPIKIVSHVALQYRGSVVTQLTRWEVGSS